MGWLRFNKIISSKIATDIALFKHDSIRKRKKV